MAGCNRGWAAIGSALVPSVSGRRRAGQGLCGPRRQLLAKLACGACLFNNALINYCKLQRTWLTVIERSTEAAMELDVHTNY